jgi:acetyl-CoA carboxylase carboxyltransferase component
MLLEDVSIMSKLESPSLTLGPSPYRWKRIALAEYRFLEPLRAIYGAEASVELFWDPSVEFNRVQADGLVAVRGVVSGRTVSVAVTDFRVSGGSFGKENMSRFGRFLAEIDLHDGCFIFLLNTLGARFTEGRSLFSPVFSVIPAIQRYAKKHPFYAAAMGKCLGLGAVFLGQAHYRIAMGEGSLVNLTGPEVLSLFFGQDSAKFEAFASAGHQFKANSLIHEILPDAETIYRRVRELAVYPLATEEASSQYLLEPDEKRPKYLKSENALVRTLDASGTHAVEVFPQLSPVARTFLVRRGDRTFGVIANPPIHPDNMLTVRAVERSRAALDLFGAMKVPVITMLDSPGGDPRASESDADAILKMVDLVHAMIDYPHGKMGVINGRCFGGSCMFVFPKIFGAQRTIAIEGSKLGIIGDAIVAKVLENNPRMKAEWAENQKRERADLSDMVGENELDAVVPLAALGAEIDRFLALVDLEKNPPASTGRKPLGQSLENRPDRLPTVANPKIS